MLKHRLLSGTTIIFVLLGAFFMSPMISIPIFSILCLFWISGGVIELFDIVEKLGLDGHRDLTLLAGILLFFSTMLAGVMQESRFIEYTGGLVIIFYIIALFVSEFKTKDKAVSIKRNIVSIGCFIYICWGLNSIAKLYFLCDNGPFLAFFMIMVTKSSDIGAYFTGTLTARSKNGNHKMIPNISPKKSWEGFFGGIIASIILSLFLYLFFSKSLIVGENQVIGYFSAILLGVLLASIGFVGDIAVSMMKRATQIKDSGSFFPGMGGFLDILDSLILTAPFFYYYVMLYSS
ncbi:MAG: phosphatidate cytidylyltransferase [Verrucomicrobiota bacterium]|nr:phosphatidate cytidylyltransferase [Verrucomicrobiota bacterium]